MLDRDGFEPTRDAIPEQFRQTLAADLTLWAPLVKALGLKVSTEAVERLNFLRR